MAPACFFRLQKHGSYNCPSASSSVKILCRLRWRDAYNVGCIQGGRNTYLPTVKFDNEGHLGEVEACGVLPNFTVGGA